MIETRGAVLRTPDSPLSVETIEFDRPHTEEVLVRLAATALCHSDLHNIKLSSYVPMLMGHEAAGVVEEVGEAVRTLAPGDKVIFTFVPACGRCYFCLRGMSVDCERGSGIGGRGELLDGTYRARTADGASLGQSTRLGALSERVVVHEDSCVKVPADTDLRVASLLSCGFTTGAGAAINIAKTEVGDSVVVIGVGGVGTAAIQGAVVAGAAEIIAVDVAEHKLESARRFGATRSVDARSDWVKAVRDATGGHGADRALLCVGNATDELVGATVAAVRKGGTAVLVGATVGLTHLAVRPAGALMAGHKVITGTMYGSNNPRRDQLRFLDLHRAGRLKLAEMITATYSLDQVNEGLADLAAGRNIRGVVEFQSEKTTP